MVKVSFRIEYFTVFGEHVKVAGSAPELGAWGDGIAMEWDGDGCWKKTVVIEALPVDYKYQVVDADGAVCWEATANRRLECAPDCVRCVVTDWWEHPEHRVVKTTGFRAEETYADLVERTRRFYARRHRSLERLVRTHRDALRRATPVPASPPASPASPASPQPYVPRVGLGISPARDVSPGVSPLLDPAAMHRLFDPRPGATPPDAQADAQADTGLDAPGDTRMPKPAPDARPSLFSEFVDLFFRLI